MTGVLIASLVDEWRQGKNEEKQFHSLAEQIYNATHMDLETGKASIRFTKAQKEFITKVKTSPDSIPDNELIPRIFDSEIGVPFHSRLPELLPFLDLRTSRADFREFITEVNGYTNQVFWRVIENHIDYTNLPIRSFLLQNNIRRPVSYGNFNNSTYWSATDIRQARVLLNSKEFGALLRNAETDNTELFNALSVQVDQCSALLLTIRKFSPNAKLIFNNVGIIGSALPTGWTQSVPMKLKSPADCIWEINADLLDGVVKFRDQNSWKYNWGGSGFPTGETQIDGLDIPVKKGNYHIEINIGSGTYTFEKITAK